MQSQEQKIQQQPYSQFMQHQTQKQHNQQHPLLVKNYNTPGQSQLLSPVDSQDMTDYGIESSRSSLQSHMPEQCQITKLQNKFQMQNASLENQTKGARLLKDAECQSGVPFSISTGPKPKAAATNHASLSTIC